MSTTVPSLVLSQLERLHMSLISPQEDALPWQRPDLSALQKRPDAVMTAGELYQIYRNMFLWALRELHQRRAVAGTEQTYWLTSDAAGSLSSSFEKPRERHQDDYNIVRPRRHL